MNRIEHLANIKIATGHFVIADVGYLVEVEDAVDTDFKQWRDFEGFHRKNGIRAFVAVPDEGLSPAPLPERPPAPRSDPAPLHAPEHIGLIVSTSSSALANVVAEFEEDEQGNERIVGIAIWLGGESALLELAMAELGKVRPA